MEGTTNRILISGQKAPASYISLIKKRLQEDGEVHLAALGSALNTLVTVTEMMKNRHLAVEVSVRTSLETLRDETSERQKARLDVTLRKSPEFDRIVAEDAKASSARKPTAHE